MRIFIIACLALLSLFSSAQVTFKVDDFSKDYYGKVFIGDTSETFSKGWVVILDRKTNNEIIKVRSTELAYELHAGTLKANIRSLPYGEQSLIMYDDFNFDGIKDFAICDGQNSCYHGPSFKIYLAQNNDFVLSESFTRLAQEYCGMFDYDAQKKRIYTMTKDGCCWHKFSEFMVVGNKPKAIKIITEQQKTPFHTTTKETWDGKKMAKESSTSIDTTEEGISTILAFKVPQNGKTIILYNINDRMLYYAILRKNEEVEFSFPLEAEYQSRDFVFDKTPGKLNVNFKNGDARYQVYEQGHNIGIIININGQTYQWKGDPKSKMGSLQTLNKVKLDNVY